MWQNIIVLLGLLLVIEGIMPALNPAAFRRALLMAAELSDSVLRRLGIAAMLSGALLIYLVK